MNTSKRTYLTTTAALCALLTVTACGTSEEEGPLSPEEVPAWADNPSEVAELPDDWFPEATDEDDGAGTEDSSEAVLYDGDLVYDNRHSCIYVANKYVVLENESNEIRTMDVPVGSNPVQAAIDFVTEEKGVASPLYVPSAMPAHYLFPGGLPVPSASTPPDLGGTGEGVPVAVIDTPHVPAGDDIDFPYFYGHGQFVADIISRGLGVEVNDETLKLFGPTDANTEFVTSEAWGTAIDEASDWLSGKTPGANQAPRQPAVVNFSAGVYPCQVGKSDGAPFSSLPPLHTLHAVASLLEANVDTVLVAAAGNDPTPGIATMPAALAGDVDAALRGHAVEGVDLPLFDGGTDKEGPQWLAQRLRAVAPRIIAVGATDFTKVTPSTAGESTTPASDEAAGIPYSTTGEWVTTVEEGCQVSTHPGGRIHYPAHPDHPDSKAVSGLLDTDVRWCGTSFAAPIVTAKVSQLMMSSGVTAEAAKVQIARQ